MIFNKMCEELKEKGFEYVGEYFNRDHEKTMNVSFKIYDYNQYDELDYVVYVSFSYFKNINELSLTVDCEGMSSFCLNGYTRLIQDVIENMFVGVNVYV